MDLKLIIHTVEPNIVTLGAKKITMTTKQTTDKHKINNSDDDSILKSLAGIMSNIFIYLFCSFETMLLLSAHFCGNNRTALYLSAERRVIHINNIILLSNCQRYISLQRYFTIYNLMTHAHTRNMFWKEGKFLFARITFVLLAFVNQTCGWEVVLWKMLDLTFDLLNV